MAVNLINLIFFKKVSHETLLSKEKVQQNEMQK